MLAGIAFLAVITASITATFIENARDRLMDQGESDVVRELKEISRGWRRWKPGRTESSRPRQESRPPGARTAARWLMPRP
jgi:hypothetical protein